MVDRIGNNSSINNSLELNQTSNSSNNRTGNLAGLPVSRGNGQTSDSPQFLAANNTNSTTATRAVNANSPPEVLLQDPRVRAMLDTIAFAEGTGNNYGRVVFGTVLRSPNNPSLVGQRNVEVTDFSRHPEILVQVRPGLNSTAAGRYQFLDRTWRGLGLPDFSPRNQDLGAIRLMQQRGMIEPLLRGDIRGAINRGAPEWASLPTTNGGSFYGGQPSRSMNQLLSTYNQSLERQRGQSPAPVNTPPANTTGGLPTATLRRGDNNNDVARVQDALVNFGHMTQEQVNTGRGTFGPRTETAIKDFQRANGLQQTGVYDQNTQNAMRSITSGVKRGDNGAVVQGLQNRLVELGYMTREQVSTGPGTFGPQTEAALRRFQADNNVQQTGVLGATTYKALQSAQARGTGDSGVVGNPGDRPTLSTRVRERDSFTRQQISSPTLGNFTITSAFFDPDGHGSKGGSLAIFSDNPNRIVSIPPGRHNVGIDYVTPDDRIRSWFGGTVERITNEAGYGNRIIIRSDQTFRFNGRDYPVYTHYAHADGFNVREGQRIRPGQDIGEQGNTGRSQGAHVDFRTWIQLEDGRRVDVSPNLLVNFR